MTETQIGDELPARTVVARNTSSGEAGSIHDDAHAARLGYRGGLVPGATLLAYLAPTLIEAFGEAWPERGRLRARFVRPAYDGETLTVRATVVRRDGGDIALECRVEGADGASCVEAEAACLLSEPPLVEPKPWRRTMPGAGPPARGTDGSLPPLRPEVFAAGMELSPLTYHLSLEEAIRWAAEAGDDGAWYRDASPFGGPIVHPALFTRDPIHLLWHNFAYKATVHAATDIAYQHVAYPDRDYTAYGYVVETHERNGNSYVVIDTLTVDQIGREIARNRHTSLIRLRSEDAP